MARAGFPDCIVEVAWPNGPFDAAPTWTDISGDIEDVKITRSTPAMSTQADPSTCDVVVRNFTGSYDPTVAGQPNVTVGKRLRVRSVWTTVSRGRYDGYIEDFVEAWDSLGRPLMVLKCVDLLGLLAARAAHDPTSYRALVIADAPSAYWRMGVGPDITVMPDEMGPASGTAGLGTSISNVGGIPVRGALDADRDTGTTLAIPDQPQQRSFSMPGTGVNRFRGTTSWTWSGWFRSTSPPTSGATQLMATFSDSSGDGYSFETYVDSQGNVTCWQGSPSPRVTFNQNTSSGTNICDGAWHHVEVTRYASGTILILKLDGVTKYQVTWSSRSYGYSPTAGQRDLAWTWLGYSGYSGGGWTGEIDEIAVWWNNVSAPAGHAAAAWANGRGRWIGQTSRDRVSLLCTLVGVPAARLSLPAAGTGKALAEPADIVNTPVADIIRRAVLSEEGQLWVDGNGQLQMRLRRSGALPVAGTAFGPADIPTAGIPQVSVALADVVNEVTVQAPNLKDVTVQNAASIAAYATRGQLPAAGSGSPAPSVSTDLTTPDDQLDMATRMAAMLGTPGAKVNSVTVTSPTAAAGPYWPQLLATEPNDVVTVKRPANPGPVTRPPVVSEIASISEEIDNHNRWDFTFALRRNYRQPVPFSRTYATVAQSIPSATWTAIDNPQRRAQADGMLSSGSPSVIYARTDGPYLLSASAWLPVASGTWGLALRVNGTTYVAITSKLVAGTPILTTATVWQLAVGDYVQMCLLQFTGAPVLVNVAGNYSPEFSAALLR